MVSKTIAGKFSRKVSQTRWIIDDERMGEASVEVVFYSNITQTSLVSSKILYGVGLLFSFVLFQAPCLLF